MPQDQHRENLFEKLLRYITNILVIIFLSSMIMSVSKTLPVSNKSILIDKNVPPPHIIPGLYNQKKELFRYIKLFKNYPKYMNVRIPKGILLTGKPGTGKTFLTKSIAVHNNINFISISGADFSFPLVGQGKAFLQNLIDKATTLAPCIIFIDEIDAIGGKRMGYHDSASSEKSSIIMLLCTYMDGIIYTPGVFFIAATNRPDMLDDALLRKGRFDVHIEFTNPTRNERRDIIKFYLVRKLNTRSNQILDYFTENTIGYSSAETESIINEVAIVLLDNPQQNLKNIIFSSKLNSELGFKKIIAQHKTDIERTLYHEVGHAIMMRLMAIIGYHANPLYISIEPRTKSLGVTVAKVDEKRVSTTFNEVIASIMVRLAGHCTEEYTYPFKKKQSGNHTLGAMSDFEGIAKLMKVYIQSGIDKSSGMIYNYGEKLTDLQTKRSNEMIQYIYSKTHLLFENKKIQKYFTTFIDKISKESSKEFFFDKQRLEDFVPTNEIKEELNNFWKNEILVPNLMYV